MTENKKEIPIEIDGTSALLTIFGESKVEETLFEKTDAAEFGEARYQIKEGCFYEYKISEGFCLEPSNIVSQSHVNPSSGRISPNIYVGTLTIGILDSKNKRKCGEIKLEVQSVKTSYREDYRQMLEEITEQCTDLLLQQSSPVTQLIQVDFSADAKTLYQRFAFIKSVLDSDEFSEAVYKVLSAPVTRWKESEIEKDIRNVKRLDNKSLRQIGSATNRVSLPINHPLKSILPSIPAKIRTSHKIENLDTPENRFVKHALITFASFLGQLITKLKDDSRLKDEALLLEDKLEQMLSHSTFKEISLQTTLPLNSPILQCKAGYREILKTWLMFDLAAKLVWNGGEDVYSGGKRDVAVLYEYWLFFKLLEIVKDVFKIDSSSIEDLIESTRDGLGLKLKQGKYLPVKGVYSSDTRKLNVEFSYNKTFSGGKKYPTGGSWTSSLRPDYTLSVWAFGVSQEKAEEEELIVHIHFDAKYKVKNLQSIFLTDENLEEEKIGQKKGNYKRADMLKMHTYRDAIRRTAGAYVLYPGSQSERKYGFHELLPGLGAFALRPSKQNDVTAELKSFLNEIVNHFMNRASQREKMSLKTYETHKSNISNEVRETLPEAFGENRNLLPDETFVLVAFYKNEEHLQWILRENLYNVRIGSTRGSIKLNPTSTGARYILLHSTGETETSKFYKLNEKGPRVFSKKNMMAKRYNDPSQPFYLVFEIEGDPEDEFKTMKWNITKLNEYQGRRGSAIPFSTSLTDLMNAIVK